MSDPSMPERPRAVKVSVWEERDRLRVHLFDGDENHTLAEWWDDDARQMFEDGFFARGPRLAASVIAYATEMGLLKPRPSSGGVAQAGPPRHRSR